MFFLQESYSIIKNKPFSLSQFLLNIVLEFLLQKSGEIQIKGIQIGKKVKLSLFSVMI